MGSHVLSPFVTVANHRVTLRLPQVAVVLQIQILPIYYKIHLSLSLSLSPTSVLSLNFGNRNVSNGILIHLASQTGYDIEIEIQFKPSRVLGQG